MSITALARLDVVDDSRTSFVQHQDDRLASFCKGADKFLLVFGKVQIVDVARSLAIAVLTHAGNYNVCIAGCRHHS